MAQYRAIFKNAYFKGLATAAVVTIGLAAGQAQAKNITNTEWPTLAGAQELTGTDTLSISGTSLDENTALTNLNITSTGNHSIKKVAASAVNADVTYNAESGQIDITNDTSAGSLKVKGFDLKKGTVNIAGEDTKLEAFTLKVGDNEGDPASSKIDLKSGSTLGVGLTEGALASQNTTLTLNNDGQINLSDASGESAVAINAAALNIKGGKLSIANNADATTTLTLNVLSGSMTDGTLEFGSGSDVKIKFGNVNVTDTNNKNLKKELTLSKGTINTSGSITFSGAGIVDLKAGDEKVKFDQIGENATLTVKGATLKTDLESAKYVAGKIATDLATGSTLDLGRNTTLDLTLTGENDLKIGNTADKDTKTIKVVDGATVKAGTIVLGADKSGSFAAQDLKLTSNSDLTLANAALSANKNLIIDANTVTKKDLVLGADSMADINQSDSFKALNNDKDRIKALLDVDNKGSISKGTNSNAALTVEGSKALKIANGTWTNDVDLTLGTTSAGGTLQVGLEDSNNKSAASLSFGSNSKLTLTSGTIAVGNARASKLLEATLDLSGLKDSNFTIGADHESTMKVEKNGTIILSQDIAEKILSSEDNKQLKTLIGAGTLKVEGDLTVTKDQLYKNDTGAASKIAFSGAGSFEAEKLTIKNLEAATPYNIGKGASIKAQTLKLDGDNGVSLGSGNFVAYKELTTTQDGKTLKLGQDTVIQLGDVNGEAGNGNVKFNLNVNAAASEKGKITVANGTWNGKDVILTQSGDFTVGGQDITATADTTDKTVASFISSGTLSIKDANSTVKVSKGSSVSFAKFDADAAAANTSTVTLDGNATFTEFYQKGAAITVSDEGKLTLAGKEVQSDNVTTSYGVELTGGTIKVDGADARVTIQDTALKAIKSIAADGSSITYATGLTTNDPFTNVVTLDNFGTLELAFANKQELNTKQVEALRKEFLANPDSRNGYLALNNVSLSDANDLIEFNEETQRHEITQDNANKLGGLAGVEVDNLKDATITGINSKPVAGGLVVGNLEADGTTSITVEAVTLTKGQNGFVTKKGSDEKVDVTVSEGGFLHLKSGGSINNISLTAGNGTAPAPDTLLAITNGATNIESVDGDSNTSLEVNGNAQVTVAQGVTVGNVETAKNTALTIKGDFETLDNDVKNVFNGALTVSGDATFAGKVELKGNTTLAGDVSFANEVVLSGDLNNLGATQFKGNAAITNGLTLAKSVTLGAQTTELVVGLEKNPEAKDPALVNGASAYLVTEKLELAKGTLFVDPSYEVASSIVATKNLTGAQNNSAGSLSGKAVVLQNSVFAVGIDGEDEAAALASAKNALAPLFDAKDALVNDKNVGAVAYFAKGVTLGNTDKLVVDAEHGLTAYNNATGDYKTKLDDNNIFLGKNSALAIDASAFSDNAVITFDNSAKVYAGENAKVILTGANVVKSANGKKLFAVTGSGTINLDSFATDGEGNKFLRVETINGWFTQNLNSLVAQLSLKPNEQKLNQDLAGVSAPVADTLKAVVYGMHNYAQQGDKGFVEKTVYGEAAGFYFKTQDNTYYEDANFTKVKNTKDLTEKLKNRQIGANGEVYYAPNNKLINNIVYGNGSPVDAETNARLAVFGGAPQAAIEAGASTYEAISARMGVGVSGVSAAANGQGGAIWVTPVYKSADADGFNADNKSYGADVKLYGLALGADIEVAPNFKVGGMFNVGSGDADGQGLGSNVSNDFDYYGLGLYAGYSMEAFSLVADVTYTAVDNDIEGNTDLGKVTTSIDSTNLSVGVTGQYKLSLAGMDVIPHAGLRYSMIDMDDYSTAYSQNDSDSINIFSVPVGVTIAKEYVTDTWTVKPSFDLTLTGNFGDDEVDATAKWYGFHDLSTNVKSEIMDNFTYGAAVGVSATSGNFGLGLGVNYTGSSNTDEFGVNANARYMF